MKTTRILTSLVRAALSPSSRSARMIPIFIFPPRRLLSVFLGVTSIAAAWCPAAQGATISIHPTQDNSIYSSNTGNSNALGFLFAGLAGNGGVQRALVQFDIASNIPAGAVINSASVDFALTKTHAGIDDLYELHSLTSAWGEGTSGIQSNGGGGFTATVGDATWLARIYNTSLWNLPGGDFASLASGTTTFGINIGVYTFASQSGLVADVQNWLNAPASNFGWILQTVNEGSGTSGRQLGSRESAGQQPTLTINYTAAPEPGSLVLLGVGTLVLSSRRRR